MTLENINVDETIAKGKELLKTAKMPAEVAAFMSILLMLFEILVRRLVKTNSSNSSIPPSQDPNRSKNLNKENAPGRKPGGQPGRKGTNLKPVESPDEIINVPVDRETLPKRRTYTPVGFERRQVINILMSTKVTEYRLEILEDEKGRRRIAKAPMGAGRPIQYGKSVKEQAVYMNIAQLIPYGRVVEYFQNHFLLNVSPGSLCTFNKEAYDSLKSFEEIAKDKLRNAIVMNSDETGINVKGELHWLHAALNEKWTLFTPHKKRGKEGMDAMDILPHFKGLSVHDHWKSYFSYSGCIHVLCNAHHLRELQWVIDNHPKSTWAKELKELLLEINEKTKEAGGVLPEQEADNYHGKYEEIIKRGEEECPFVPPPPDDPPKKKRGRVKKSKERNLLERLRDFKEETLRFMGIKEVPFTNNDGERDIRMSKVKMKISGCFKSFEGFQHFCRIRSYLITAQKHGMSPTEALRILFSGKLPDFCYDP